MTGFNFSFEGTKHPGEPDVTPTAGINDVSSGTFSTVNIPVDAQLLTGFGAQFGITDGLASGQPSGQPVFTLFGAVSNLSTSAITYNGDLTIASITVFFTYTGSTDNNADSVVVAWGGHIASSLDWRDNPGETVQTASDISGSPYHTRVLTLFENGVATSIGNQDRSLSAAAVFAPRSPLTYRWSPMRTTSPAASATPRPVTTRKPTSPAPWRSPMPPVSILPTCIWTRSSIRPALPSNRAGRH